MLRGAKIKIWLDKAKSAENQRFSSLARSVSNAITKAKSGLKRRCVRGAKLCQIGALALSSENPKFLLRNISYFSIVARSGVAIRKKNRSYSVV
jgi:hypothetical protein